MTESFESVWDAIEGTPAAAENLKIRSSLMIALKRHIRDNGLTQAQAAKKFGVTQPRISDLMRGRINLFSIDTLVNMLATVGLHLRSRSQKQPSPAATLPPPPPSSAPQSPWRSPHSHA